MSKWGIIGCGDVIEVKSGLAFSKIKGSDIEKNGQNEEIENVRPAHVHQPLVETIVGGLNGIGTGPSTGSSGARTTWEMDQLLNRYYKR